MLYCKERHRLLAEYQRAAVHLEACLRALQHSFTTSSPAVAKRLQQSAETARQQTTRALLALEVYLGMCRC